MLSKINSIALLGLSGVVVKVEASLSFGMPNFFLVGMADTSIKEARERVRSAMKKSNLPFPRGRITVNLAPAMVKKQGTHFDLPIAMSLLLAEEETNYKIPDNAVFLGELALTGEVRPIAGALVAACAAKEQGYNTIFVPAENARETALVENLQVFPVRTLEELTEHLLGNKMIEPLPQTSFDEKHSMISDLDMKEIRGQESAKRALEIAAAGMHNVLLSGPPGSGKTLLSRTMPSILPPITLEEALEVTKIFSVSGILPTDCPLITSRPFRSPHHSASAVSIVGGGSWPRPGEISLAHRGILFLDEFPEFPRSVIENLRQPLEDGIVTVSRANGTFQFPARFMLVAAMNPCPCGYSTDIMKRCICTTRQILEYRKKISGPIIDRIDLTVDVPRVDFEKLTTTDEIESSQKIRSRVIAARTKQYSRFLEYGIFTNSEMTSPLVRKYCELDEAGKKIMRSAMEKMALSARSYTRLLKIARTIADLESAEKIETKHLAEALQYRIRVEEE